MTTSNLEELRSIPLHLLVGSNKLTKKIKIRCPFHREKTASCTLFPNGGYHCYGCGASGNSIDFVMRVGATFEEALTELSKYGKH